MLGALGDRGLRGEQADTWGIQVMSGVNMGPETMSLTLPSCLGFGSRTASALGCRLLPAQLLSQPFPSHLGDGAEPGGPVHEVLPVAPL